MKLVVRNGKWKREIEKRTMALVGHHRIGVQVLGREEEGVEEEKRVEVGGEGEGGTAEGKTKGWSVMVLVGEVLWATFCSIKKVLETAEGREVPWINILIIKFLRRKLLLREHDAYGVR